MKTSFPWKTLMVLLTMIVLAAIIAHTVLTSVDKFRTGNITTTFVSDIPVVTSTHGDVLELARARTVETVSSQDASYLYSIYLGTTSAEIRVPVTYRYHLLLSEPWHLAARGNVCIVEAPMFHASLPPAIQTEQMEKRAESGWARFDKDQVLADLEKHLTTDFSLRASDKDHLNLVREQCRSSVADFVRKWLISRSQWQNKFDAIIVVFPDEHAFASDQELEKYHAAPAIEIPR